MLLYRIFSCEYHDISAGKRLQSVIPTGSCKLRVPVMQKPIEQLHSSTAVTYTIRSDHARRSNRTRPTDRPALVSDCLTASFARSRQDAASRKFALRRRHQNSALL